MRYCTLRTIAKSMQSRTLVPRLVQMLVPIGLKCQKLLTTHDPGPKSSQLRQRRPREPQLPKQSVDGHRRAHHPKGEQHEKLSRNGRYRNWGTSRGGLSYDSGTVAGD